MLYFLHYILFFRVRETRYCVHWFQVVSKLSKTVNHAAGVLFPRHFSKSLAVVAMCLLRRGGSERDLLSGINCSVVAHALMSCAMAILFSDDDEKRSCFRAKLRVQHPYDTQYLKKVTRAEALISMRVGSLGRVWRAVST